MTTFQAVAVEEGTVREGGIRSALRHRAFRRLLVALAVSQAGDWLYNVALLAFVYQRTHSAAWVAVTTAVRVIPMVALGPLGGVVADRFDRRKVMIASDVVRAACMVALFFVAAAGLPVVLAPVLAGLATAASVAYPPSTAGSTSRLVPAADLAGANAARSAVGTAAVAAGPVVGAVLLLLGSPAAAFAVNAGTFAISALTLLSIPAGPAFRPARTGERQSVVADVADGARALREHPHALRLIGADIACSVVYGMQTVLLLLLSRELGFGDAGYGYLLAAIGVGGILGTLVAPRAARSGARTRVLALALLAVAGPAGLMAITPCLTGLLLWGLCVGAGAIVVEVLTETSLQADLDDAVFARAYGIAFPAAIAGIVGGSLVAAPLASAVGLTGALLAPGLLTAAYALVVALPRRARTAALPGPAVLAEASAAR